MPGEHNVAVTYGQAGAVCPQCGSEKRHDEHEVTEVTPAATTAERGEDADDGDGEASEM